MYIHTYISILKQKTNYFHYLFHTYSQHQMCAMKRIYTCCNHNGKLLEDGWFFNLFLFVWKTLVLVCHSSHQTLMIFRAGPGCQALGTPSGSPMWASGTQVMQPSSCCLHGGKLSGSWSGKHWKWDWISEVPGVSLTYCYHKACLFWRALNRNRHDWIGNFKNSLPTSGVVA